MIVPLWNTGVLAMYFLLRWYLKRIIRRGDLEVTAVNGIAQEFGDGTGNRVSVRLTKRSLYWKLAFYPDRFAGEAYMDGTLVVESGTIYELLDLLSSQFEFDQKSRWNLIDRMRNNFRRLAPMNLIDRARKNVAHHYDLSGEIYDLFLDRDRQYSCAYYEFEDQSLEEAQLAKKRHLAAKLALAPGMKILDIGSGWGGLAIYLAEVYDVEVVGVTLSKEQHKVSRQRVKNRGLKDKIDIRLLDYRQLDEKFDRIVSVGMFEHVGLNHYREFFKKLQELLHDDGVALVHSIGRPLGPSETSSWFKKYIFPGAYVPALSEIQPAIEETKLYLCDVEILRLHYAKTLRDWRQRFVGNWDKAAHIYDERFCRMWEFYLAGTEASFRRHVLNVFQIQITKHQDTLPLTRDYIFEEEDKLRQFDKKSSKFKSVSSR